MKVALYLRLSEDRHGTGAGVERQEKECREYAERQGLVIGEVYVDNDVSATTGIRRPAFEQMLADRPAGILCWHTDRLCRLNRDMERVIELDVTVYAAVASLVDLSTPGGRMQARIATTIAAHEGEQKAERQRASHRQRIERGGTTSTGRPWWPTRPLGFEMDGSHHPVEGPALSRIYDDLLKGGTLVGATRYLKSLDIRTSRSGKHWSTTSLRPVLLNPRNAGILSYRGEEKGKAPWAPLVREDVYRAVCAILTDPSRRNHGSAPRSAFRVPSNLLTNGPIRCVKCMGTLRAGWRYRNGERDYKMYECSGCRGTTVPAEWADSLVLRKVIQRAELWQDRLPTDAGSSAELSALQAEVRTLEERSRDARKMFMRGKVTEGEFDEMREDAQLSIAAARERMAQIAASSVSIDPADIERLWEWVGDDDAVSVDRMRPIIEKVIERGTVKGLGKGGRGSPPADHLQLVWRL